VATDRLIARVKDRMAIPVLVATLEERERSGM
jgi:hypothetical protein